ncbi:hypothetical protein LINPERPRIM_LOCUS20939, partial [Linum perenne]
MSAGPRRDLMPPRAPGLPLPSHPPSRALHQLSPTVLGTTAPLLAYPNTTLSATG